MRPIPHVIHILGTLGVGGAQRMVLNMITSAELQGYRHSIVCIIAKQGGFLEYCAEQSIPVYECPLWWPKSTPIPSYRINRWLRGHLSFTFPRRMGALLKQIDADLVHTHVTASVSLQARAALRQARLPWIWTLHGLCRTEGMDISDLPITTDLLNGSKAVITGVCKAALDEVVSDTAIPPRKTRVIYNAVNLDRFDPSIVRDPLWRAKWGIPQNAVVLGGAGRLVNIKRFDLFIDAAAEMIRKGSPAHFVIAGDGSLRGSLEQRIRKLGIGARFHLVGVQTDMQRFLREIDVMVLSSDSEAFPLVLLEACAMNVPCIATAVGGVPEILEHGCGILIERGSVETLVRAMESMMNASTRQQYANKGRETAERFSLSRIAAEYAALYDELLGRA